MQIVSLAACEEEVIRQAASLLVDGFKDHWPGAWPDLDAALDEVRQFLTPERIARVAIREEGGLLGWIGGISSYGGNVWELHPLVVGAGGQGRGIGRALVKDFEEQVRLRGGVTIWLGTDDEDNMTSLSGVDLYPNVLEHAMRITNLRRHPYEFYQKLGFVIVGVMPDANGKGKPDIYMAKRVAPHSSE